MKKIIILFTMVLAVSMANAQQTTWVTQTGYDNTANVTQEACISGLSSAIYGVQTGTWNTLNATQTGMNNYIELRQDGARNVADMKQSTCDFPGTTIGGNNSADIYQSGNYGTANLVQKEVSGGGWDFDVNYANAVQSGSHNNYNLQQGRVIFGANVPYIPKNTSLLRQSGYANDAGIMQGGKTDYSEIRQTGTWNRADLHQRGIDQDGPSNYSEAISYSWQTGARNTLDILQDNNPNVESVNSVQSGSYNITNVEQIGKLVQNVVSAQHGSHDVINVLQKNN